MRTSQEQSLHGIISVFKFNVNFGKNTFLVLVSQMTHTHTHGAGSDGTSALCYTAGTEAAFHSLSVEVESKQLQAWLHSFHLSFQRLRDEAHAAVGASRGSARPRRRNISRWLVWAALVSIPGELLVSPRAGPRDNREQPLRTRKVYIAGFHIFTYVWRVSFFVLSISIIILNLPRPVLLRCRHRAKLLRIIASSDRDRPREWNRQKGFLFSTKHATFETTGRDSV